MNAEVAIIGGGLAGAASAVLLARAGRDVVLLERDATPKHKVCGEFLSREALIYLTALGIDLPALGAVPIESVRVGNGRSISLPFPALSLTRRTLDEALLQMAKNAGAKVLRGCTVLSLEQRGAESICRLNDGELQAQSIFLATGKHDLRGQPRLPGSQNDLLALKMYWRLAPQQVRELEGHVELILYRGGYAGLQPVEGGMANLCCLVQRSELKRAGGHWELFLETIKAQSPHLSTRLNGAESLLAKPLALAAIPYGMVREATPGLWCLGDQAAVIPSFTGDGMSIALHTAALAAQMYLAGESPESYAYRVQAHLKKQVRLATLLSRAMVAYPKTVQAGMRLWPGLSTSIAEHTRIAAEFVAG